MSEPVYAVALFAVPDVQAYRREYGRKVVPQLEAIGAKLLAASGEPTVLEGQWPASWTAVIEFPDRDAAMRWYESEDYAPLKRLRIEELSTGGTVALLTRYSGPVANPI